MRGSSVFTWLFRYSNFEKMAGASYKLILMTGAKVEIRLSAIRGP